jgi:AraC-like DNA-binding protein
MRGEMRWESKDIEICEINFSPAFFRRFLPEDSTLFMQFQQAMEKGEAGMLQPYNNRISHPMYQLIHEIMQCNRKGIFKKMFLEAKVIELLLLQFEQLSDAKPYHTSLKKNDIDKIYAVREYLQNNLNNPCSLINLAHHVGTNEFTLKRGFKELFGTTVFGFWNDIKMAQAKQMLTEQQMTVGEVSFQVGYKDQRHFSAAFKRKYGILPSQLKK